MKKLFFFFFFSGLLFVSCSNNNKSAFIELETEFLKTSIDGKGSFIKFIDIRTGKDYLSKDTTATLMSIKINNEILPPQSAEQKENTIILRYKNNIEAIIKLEQKESHLSFELLSLTNNENIDLIIWGPYPSTINKIIGETVGLVQGEEYAIGIQALNPKTIGGYPWKDNDCMPQIDIFDQDDLSDMSEEGKRGVLYRVEAAKPFDFGSTLQAYCRNRSTDRVIENWSHKKYLAPAFNDGGVIGSKIALFGCPAENALEYIGKIEISEGLPHPLIDGEWAKTSTAASSAYLIIGFGEENIEKAIDITKKFGLKYLYHPGPFKNWGHFDLNEKQFPRGIESMKNCVEIANEHGVILGLHTLSNFISTNDPYVTPVPDKRLAKVGSSHILDDINESQTEILIESPDFFNQYKNNHLKTVMLGGELIRYGTVSENQPWKLLDCQRGAFNTTASKHQNGSVISKLADHAYKVFLTNNDLSKEVAENIAELFNNTGLRQISFDGIEGNRSTGMGNYGEILFAKAWYDKLNNNIKSHYIADASRTSHYFWHIYSRMNWGEPWYAGFRESQTEYRLKNQKYFKRNLMPSMLGWFLMTPETSIEDIEWLLARTAAFDAGYALVTNFEAIEKNGNSEKIMHLIGEWEKVRLGRLLSDDQKQRMEDLDNEFSLEKINEKEWNFYQVFSGKFKHEQKVRQPGEPLYSTFNFEHKGNKQTLNFIMSANDCDVSDITIEKDNYKKVVLDITLKAGEFIKYTGGEKAYVYDKNWQKINEFKIDSTAFAVSKGKHAIIFDCQFNNTGKEAMIKFETRTFGTKEKIVSN